MNGRKLTSLVIVLLTIILTTCIADKLDAAKKAEKPKKKTPVTSEFAGNNVYQVIPNSVFSAPAPDNEYFLSGWICPGTGSAMLTFATFNGGGKLIDSAGVEVASDGEIIQIGSALDIGILDEKAFKHPAYPGLDLVYYRVYSKFAFTSGAGPVKETRIILQNTSNAVASCSVWFDGIKLEKAIKSGQNHPTTYHTRGNIISPDFRQPLKGGPDIYEC